MLLIFCTYTLIHRRVRGISTHNLCCYITSCCCCCNCSRCCRCWGCRGGRCSCRRCCRRCCCRCCCCRCSCCSASGARCAHSTAATEASGTHAFLKMWNMRNLKMVFCLDPYKGGVVAAGSDGQFRQRETIPG